MSVEITINSKPIGLYLEGVAFDDTEGIDCFIEQSEEFAEALAGRDIKCITHNPDGRVDFRVR